MTYSINVNDLNRPGLVRIYCEKNNRSLIIKCADSVWFGTRRFFLNLENGFCENKLLLDDSKKFGYDFIQVDFLVWGKEYFNQEKLQNDFNFYKDKYRNNYYE